MVAICWEETDDCMGLNLEVSKLKRKWTTLALPFSKRMTELESIWCVKYTIYGVILRTQHNTISYQIKRKKNIQETNRFTEQSLLNVVLYWQRQIYYHAPTTKSFRAEKQCGGTLKIQFEWIHTVSIQSRTIFSMFARTWAFFIMKAVQSKAALNKHSLCFLYWKSSHTRNR